MPARRPTAKRIIRVRLSLYFNFFLKRYFLLFQELNDASHSTKLWYNRLQHVPYNVQYIPRVLNFLNKMKSHKII